MPDIIITYDFVYKSIYDAIVKWYEDNYVWHDKYTRLGIHLGVFIQEYDACRFKDSKIIGQEREKFLEEIQYKMEEYRAIYA